MARQIRLDQIDDVMSEAVQKLVAKVTWIGLEELKKQRRKIPVIYLEVGKPIYKNLKGLL